MLDAYIIEELKRRNMRKRDRARPSLELPVDECPPPASHEEDDGEENEDGEGGVIIIDYDEEED